QAEGTGDHRLRHGAEPAAGRGPPGRAPARRRSPRPFDPGALGPGRGPPRRGRPGGAGPGLRRAGRHPGAGRDLFWGRPTLVGSEPASLTAVFCRAAADRKAATWEGQLAPFSRWEFALSDGATGIAAAVASRAEARRDDPSAGPLEHGLDV